MQIETHRRNRGTRQLRLGRQSISKQIYHISTATKNRIPILGDLQCGRTIVHAFAHEQCRNNICTLAYVIMPDHFHWLMQLPEHADLSQSVSKVKSLSARAINRLAKTRGSIWQRGFFDRGIRSNEDLVAVARYIIANPLRAGIVDDIGQYSLWDAVWVNGNFQL